MPVADHAHEYHRIGDCVHDLLIVGAGINGAGIARDASGRGLSTLLCDQGDIGGATSSASSKLIHGGLRYLEQGEFGLVAEALAEREVVLRLAPHLAHPLRFVLPHEGGIRPAWIVRLGLLFYDILSRLSSGARPSLPRSIALDLRRSPLGSALLPKFTRGHAYFDVSVDDARLTMANARAAADLGAIVLRDTRFLSARRVGDVWIAALESRRDRRIHEVRARALINATGPWVGHVLSELPPRRTQAAVQLVKGSHIVVPQLYSGEHAYILQNDDRRVVFLLPFMQAFTLIGTTDVKVSAPQDAHISNDEIAYLCRAVNRHSRRPITPTDVLWSYAGVRPLFDDGHGDPAKITRDYHFLLDDAKPPALSIVGGKLTTYRRLAERALAKLAPWFPNMGTPWTRSRPLPGGDFASLPELDRALVDTYPKLPLALLTALARRHGTLAYEILGDARTSAELGRDFGAGLFECELEYFIEKEWARNADDILWRRSKFGLTMSAVDKTALAAFLEQRLPGPLRHAAA